MKHSVPTDPAVLWLTAGNHPVKIGTGAVVDVVPGEENGTYETYF